MKKLKYFVLLLAMILVLPFAVFAEGEGDAVPVEDGGTNENANEADKRAVVYFFRGDGCPHCQEAEAWFASIQEEYGDRFVIKDFETWNNADNAELMNKINEVRNDGADGVPYIIIGDKSWIGFSETTMADEIKAQIDQVYAQDVSERYDAFKVAGIDPNTGAETAPEEESKTSDVVGLIIILVVAGGLGFGIYQARKHSN